MTIKSRIIERASNALIILVLFLVLGLYSLSVQAQSFKPIKYVGFEAFFGSRAFDVKSNISAIDQMHSGQAGGSLGVVFGNEIIKAKIRAAGFYYSDDNTPRTQDLFETAGLINFYPLSFISTKSGFRPYVTGGLSMEQIKFFGKYLPEQKSNRAYEPLVGKISQLNATGGIGIGYWLTSEVDFVHFFAEALYGVPLQSRASVEAFSNTSIKQFTSFSVGVAFGRHR